MEIRKCTSPGRPRSFDRDAALRTALDLFWRQGYEGVSIAELTAAMGIAPPSLYAAFGSKADLYREVVTLYQERPFGQLQAFLADGPIDERVEGLLRSAVRAVTDPNHPRGCMISAGLLFSGPEHAELAETIAALRTQRCAQIAARLQRAIDAGELAAGPDAGAMARYLCAVTQGIAIQARDGATPAELYAIVDVTLRSWRHGSMTGETASAA